MFISIHELREKEKEIVSALNKSFIKINTAIEIHDIFFLAVILISKSIKTELVEDVMMLRLGIFLRKKLMIYFPVNYGVGREKVARLRR